MIMGFAKSITKKQWQWTFDRYLEGYRLNELTEFLGVNKRTLTRYWDFYGMKKIRDEIAMQPLSTRKSEFCALGNDITLDRLLPVGNFNPVVLRQHRKKLGLTQEEMAEKIGVSRRIYVKWECGKCTPRTKNFLKLLDYFRSAGVEEGGG